MTFIPMKQWQFEQWFPVSIGIGALIGTILALWKSGII
jgi:hypothetical protein